MNMTSMKSKLKGMKMPSKPMAEKEAAEDLDLESLEAAAPEAEMVEGEGEMGMEMESALMDISDEELLAEVKARGLSLDAAPEMEESETAAY